MALHVRCDSGYQGYFLSLRLSHKIDSRQIVEGKILFLRTPHFMRKLHVLMLILVCGFGAVGAAHCQDSSESGRRLVQKVDPRYPEIAKRMNLGGTVKVVAVVAANGQVKKVEPVGGSPILVQAAQSAISQWKYAPGSESRETVELHFTP